MKKLDNIKIIIADDHALINDGIKSMLSNEKNIEVIKQVFSGDKVLENLPKNIPIILLLDINMPQINSIELAKIITENYPLINIIILSMYSDNKFVQECIKLKIKGYILKNASKDKLIKGINAVFNQQPFFDEDLKSKPNSIQNDEFLKKFKLTKREIEIIRLVKENYTSQEIAAMLFLSVFTVKTHRRNINLKLGIKNTVSLINFSTEQGI